MHQTRWRAVAAAAVVAAGLVALPSSSAAAAPTCNGLPITIAGTPGNDVITGTPGNDVIDADPGNDVVNGLGGNDTICAGAGNDTITGGQGTDWIDGGADTDTADYTGPAGPVTVNLATGTATGGAGNDTLAGIENVNGSGGADTLTGNAGPNTISGGPGNDVLDADGGNDTVSYGNAAPGVVVDLAAGTATGGAGNDTLLGFENVVGSNQPDVLTGNGVNNAITGLGGDDLLDGAGGTDTASYSTAPAAVSVDLTTGASSGGAGNDTLIGFENLNGSSFADTLLGDGAANFVLGGPGNDVLDGRGGTDTLGYDTAPAGVTVDLGLGTSSGGAGNDAVIGFETVSGSAFADSITGSAGAETVLGNGGADALDGGAGIDTVSYASAPGSVNVDLSTGTASGAAGADALSGFESVQGSSFDDVLTGDFRSNNLIGLPGNDVLHGGLGVDILVGNGGDDTLDGGPDTDHDVAVYSTSAAGVTADLAAGTATGDGNDTLVGISVLIGSSHDDVLLGDAADDVLLPGAGTDVVDGRGGVDALNFSTDPIGPGVAVDLTTGTGSGAIHAVTITGIESVTGSPGDDVLTGDGGTNVLHGGAGNDAVTGGGGRDVVHGGDGDDALDGGLDDDIVAGGAGTDGAVGGGGLDVCVAEAVTGCSDAAGAELAIPSGAVGDLALPAIATSFSHAGFTTADLVLADYTANPGLPALYADELVGITATGATPRSVATVQVYWPASTADAITSLVWFDGTSWVPVVGSVVKNTTDDLDGTDSGGRFTVTLSTTSSPSVTALAGTVVAVAVERPTSKDDCKQGGWQRYGIFPNQGQCVSWVNHH